MQKNHFLIIGVCLVVIACIFFVMFSGTASLTGKAFGSYLLEHSYVTKVIDGDTVVIGGGARVRLLNIDTREKGENCYKEAKERMEELVLLKNVTLERDKENMDRYDRLLRHIYVGNLSVNLQMVKEGLAVVYVYEPNVRYRQIFTEAEAQARQEGGCVWTNMP